MSRPKINLFTGLLSLLLVLSAFPIAVLINRSVSSLNEIENLSNETIDSIVKEETDRIYKARAEDLAQQVAEFLKSREFDLETLAQIPQTPEAYLRFSKAHLRGVQNKPDPIALYKEVAFISANGREVIKIADNRIVPQEGLLNVSIPTNTTYKSETYFHDTRASTSPIHVSKLTGWYVSRWEQMELGKEYSGVIRFCKKALDDQENFAGIFMLALDHQHLMNFIRGEFADDRSLLEDYQLGKHSYVYDEEGWVIAHPKLWDIRGVDQQGVPVPAYTEQTPS